MRRHLRCRATVAAALVALSCGGCRVAPIDPFDAAVDAVADGRLDEAIRRLDALPPAHPRFARGRSLARAVERRVRTWHEFVLRALELRAEWRDRDASRWLSRARSVWPEAPGLGDWVVATRERAAHLRGGSEGADERRAARGGAVVSTRPVDRSLTVARAPFAAPLGEGRLTAPFGEPPRVASDPRDDRERIRELDERGGIDEAVDLVGEELARGADEALRVLLVDLLNRRALARYGRGELAAARSDWRRLLQLEPNHAIAVAFLRAARAESERLRRAGALSEAPELDG